MRESQSVRNQPPGLEFSFPEIQILTLSHGAGHQRLANALRRALIQIRPGLTIEIVNALERCAAWFHLYYDSYQLPLNYWPSLWAWIESVQHAGTSTGPAWLYRRGARPLFRFIQKSDPDIVIATEVGLCEMAAMLKRESHARFFLVAAPGLDVDRAWVQPEVDLYLSSPIEVTAQLMAAGAPPARIAPSGMPIDPAFDSLPDRLTIRARLGLHPDNPLLLVLFGGMGYGKSSRIVPALKAIRQPLQVTFITGINHRLEEQLLRECGSDPRFRVLGWVDNIHEWMAAADLLLSKPGETTVCEAIDCGLPILAFDPLPGAERRTCDLIEKWMIGCSVARPEQLAPLISRLLADRTELQFLRDQCSRVACPRSAASAAEAILKMWQQDDPVLREDNLTAPATAGPDENDTPAQLNA